MRWKTITSIFIILSLFIAFPSATIGQEQKTEEIRDSILAGSWYPRDRQTLIKSIEKYMNGAGSDPIEGKIVAVIVPHAGHTYSGPVAAYVYNALKDFDYNCVIIIGPSHQVGFRGVSVNLQSAYQTPLGITPVNQALASRMISFNKLISFVPEAHAQEHSIEIQLPFLQYIYEDFNIVPVLTGYSNYQTFMILSNILLTISRENRGTLIMASSDLSHYHTQDKAEKLDKEFIRYVTNLDPEGLAGALSKGTCEACGGGPVIATMLAAKALGANRVKILNYATSGDVTGDKSRVVGYMAALFIRE